MLRDPSGTVFVKLTREAIDIILYRFEIGNRDEGNMSSLELLLCVIDLESQTESTSIRRCMVHRKARICSTKALFVIAVVHHRNDTEPKTRGGVAHKVDDVEAKMPGLAYAWRC